MTEATEHVCIHYLKLKSFCIGEILSTKMKKQPSKQEKTFANRISDKGLVFRIYKEPIAKIQIT